MRCECPTFKRCCFCVPLRYGILVWAYIKLIMSVVLSGIIISSMVIRYAITIFASIMVAVLLVDIVFHVTFIVGAHKKNYKLIRVYYYYGLVAVGLFVGFMCVQVGFAVHMMSSNDPMFVHIYLYILIRSLAVEFTNIALLLYLVLLVRSEMVKLHDNQKFRFDNIAGEAQCTMTIDTDDNQKQKTELTIKNDQETN